MSLFVLDTDTLTLLQRRVPAVCERAAVHANETAITVLTVEEQLSGWYALLRKVKKPDRLVEAYRSLAENVRFLSRLHILDYDAAAHLRYEELKRQKLNVGKFDLRIAAVALRHGGIVVTCNVCDFQRIPGLPVEDWSK
jgi:tRNA(fMet)-specific endonuclease VapC